MNSKTIKSFALVLAFCLACATQAIGQLSIISYTQLLGTFKGDKEIACEHNQYLITYYHSTATTGAPHQFIVQDLQNNVSKKFPMEANYNPSGGGPYIYTYTIHDMRVDESDVCYFCGVRTTSITDTPPEPPDSSPTDLVIAEEGFVGWFDISDVLAGSGTYTVLILNQTKELTRIEPRGSDEQVFAVGTTAAGSSCIVGLDRQVGLLGWNYDLITSYDPDEVFTDVVNSGEGPVFASRFAGYHYRIGLRHTKNGPLNNLFYFGLLGNCNVYNMQSSGNGVLWRKDTDPLLLTGNNGPVSLAHSCANGGEGLALYRIVVVNMGDAQITHAQHIASTNYIRLQDASTIANSLGSRVHLLAENSTAAQWELYTFDRANITPPPTAATLTTHNTIAGDWQWLGKYGNYLYITGHRSDNRILRFMHIFNQISPSNSSCLGNVADMTAVNLPVPSLSSGPELSRVIKNSTDTIVKDLNVISTTVSTVCPFSPF